MGPKLPANFNFTRPAMWPEWKQRYQRYHRISKTDQETEEFQVDSLLCTMGDTSDKIVKLFDGEKLKKYSDMLKELDNYFQPKTSVAHCIVKFNGRQQQTIDSNEEYIREPNCLVEKCNFGMQMMRM
jgi:hypothetical protein